MKMKKLNYLIGFSAIGLALFLASCSDTTNPAPTITFNNTGDTISLAAGLTATTITGKVVAEAKLKSATFFKVTDLSETQIGAVITDFESGIFSTTDDINYTFSEDVTDLTNGVKIKLSVTDKDDQATSKSIVIKIESSSGGGGNPITTYTDKELCGQGNSACGSSFASSDGTVYTIANAKANSAKIDWMYFYGTSNHATIAAPNDADAATVFNDATNGLATWTTRNATVFKSVSLGTTAWDDITDDTKIVELATGLSASKINSLAVDNVIAFQTASTSSNASKKGLIKILTISGTSGTDRTITFSVKIQQ
jgi:hypothetical protein